MFFLVVFFLKFSFELVGSIDSRGSSVLFITLCPFLGWFFIFFIGSNGIRNDPLAFFPVMISDAAHLKLSLELSISVIPSNENCFVSISRLDATSSIAILGRIAVDDGKFSRVVLELNSAVLDVLGEPESKATIYPFYNR